MLYWIFRLFNLKMCEFCSWLVQSRSFGLWYILYVCIYVSETAMSIICQRTCALNNIWSPPQYLITENHTPLRVLFTRHFFWYSFETMSDNFYSITYIQVLCPPFFLKKKYWSRSEMFRSKRTINNSGKKINGLYHGGVH